MSKNFPALDLTRAIRPTTVKEKNIARMVIFIDGPMAAGKSTMLSILKKRFNKCPKLKPVIGYVKENFLPLVSDGLDPQSTLISSVYIAKQTERIMRLLKKGMFIVIVDSSIVTNHIYRKGAVPISSLEKTLQEMADYFKAYMFHLCIHVPRNGILGRIHSRFASIDYDEQQARTAVNEYDQTHVDCILHLFYSDTSPYFDFFQHVYEQEIYPAISKTIYGLQLLKESEDTPMVLDLIEPAD